jgi:hypothetical protein
MRFHRNSNQTPLIDALHSRICDTPDGTSRSSGYWHLPMPLLADYGLKIQVTNILPTSRSIRREALESVSDLAIISSPLKGLGVGARVARGTNGYDVSLHEHIPNAITFEEYLYGNKGRVNLTPPIAAQHLQHMRTLNMISDEGLACWLRLLHTIQSTGHCVDMVGDNILFNPTERRLHWHDVDDQRALRFESQAWLDPSRMHTTQQIIGKLHAFFKVSAIESTLRSNLLDHNATQQLEQWHELESRIKRLAIANNIATDDHDYLSKFPIQPPRQPETILESIPMTTSVSHVAKLLNEAARTPYTGK